MGTATPANKLDVNGAEAIGTYAGTAGLSNGLIVSGNVGLGTSAAVTGYELTANGGIYGTQSSSTYAGVYGTNTSVSGAGYGGYFSTSTTGAGYGAYHIASGTGNTGYAGYFTNTSTGVVNYGLYASTSSTTGYAGFFQGAVNVTGNLTGYQCSPLWYDHRQTTSSITGTCTGCGNGALIELALVSDISHRQPITSTTPPMPRPGHGTA